MYNYLSQGKIWFVWIRDKQRFEGSVLERFFFPNSDLILTNKHKCFHFVIWTYPLYYYIIKLTEHNSNWKMLTLNKSPVHLSVSLLFWYSSRSSVEKCSLTYFWWIFLKESWSQRFSKEFSVNSNFLLFLVSLSTSLFLLLISNLQFYITLKV